MEYVKVFVSEVPDPPVGVWRQITHPCTLEVAKVWFDHIMKTGESHARYEYTREGTVVWAMRMSPEEIKDEKEVVKE